MFRAVLYSLIIFTLSIGTAYGTTSKRIALVVGNSSYIHAPALKNPGNDAVAISQSLSNLGFEVITARDQSQTQLIQTIRNFPKTLQGADVGLFYYSGHALQVSGKNYIAPVDARLEDETDLEFGTITLTSVIRQMERNTKTNLVFLDACRDNPLLKDLARSMGTRSSALGRGLAQEATGVGTMIAFSTQPGNVALDGKNEFSPFTAAILNHIESPNLDVAEMMRRVRPDVIAETDRKQVPWNHSSLTNAFSFNPQQNDLAGAQQQSVTRKSKDLGDAAFVWKDIQNTKDRAVLKMFISQFADTAPFYSKLAQQRLALLKPANNAPLKNSSPPSIKKIVADIEIAKVGRWPEEMVLDGNNLWIAESGRRTLGRFDLGQRKITKNEKVGRLPVVMKAAPDGDIYSLVVTDGIVWTKKSGASRGKRLIRISRDYGYPHHMAVDESYVWVVLSRNDGTPRGRLLKISRRSGKILGNKTLSNMYLSIHNAHGNLWVSLEREIGKLDTKTMEMSNVVRLPGNFATFTSNSDNLFVVIRSQAGSQIMAISPNNGTVVNQSKSKFKTEHALLADATDEHIVVLDYNGSTNVFSARTLSQISKVTTKGGTFRPSGLLLHNGQIFITSSDNYTSGGFVANDNSGNLIIIKDWN